MKSIKFVTAWRTVRKKDSYITFHSHDYYELVYYCNGHGRTHIGSKCYEYGDGNFVLIPSSMSHDEIHDSDSDLFCVGFQSREELVFDFYRDEQGRIANIVRAILDESMDQQIGYQDMLDIKLQELVIWLRRLAGNRKTRPELKNFEYVVNYISENYHEKIQLKDFADGMNFSYDYFQHQFKKLMGVSPQQFLISRRVEAAAEMLSAGEASCTEIACRCGFSGSAQFSAIFKRERGINPLQYRQKTRESTSEQSS